MDLFEAIKNRRSIRRYTDKKVPADVISKAFEHALLAPNSSNAQTWDFYAPKSVVLYYQKLLPAMYRWGLLNSLGYLKKLLFFTTGIFRPITRKPGTLRDVQEVCIKSAALAAENFVLAITAQGYSSCMMEGFDELRVKKLLSLKYSDRIVMVIAVGEEAERGTWGPQFRIDSKKVIHEV